MKHNIAVCSKKASQETPFYMSGYFEVPPEVSLHPKP